MRRMCFLLCVGLALAGTRAAAGEHSFGALGPLISIRRTPVVEEKADGMGDEVVFSAAPQFLAAGLGAQYIYKPAFLHNKSLKRQVLSLSVPIVFSAPEGEVDNFSVSLGGGLVVFDYLALSVTYDVWRTVPALPPDSLMNVDAEQRRRYKRPQRVGFFSGLDHRGEVATLNAVQVLIGINVPL